MPEQNQVAPEAPKTDTREGAIAPSPPEVAPGADETLAQKKPDAAERARQAFLARSQKRAERDRAIAEQNARLVAQERERATKLEADLKEKEAKLEAYKRDPVVAAAKDGVNVEESIRSFVGQTTPEALIKSLREELEATKKAIADQAEASKKAQEERDRAAAAQTQQAAIERFTGFLTDDPKKFPHLNAELTKDEIRAAVLRTDEWLRKNATRTYTAQEIADDLEAQAKVLYTKKQERRKALLEAQASDPPASAPVTAKGQTSARQPAPENARRASGPSANGTTTGKRPSRVLTRAEEEAADIAALKAAIARDKAELSKMNGAPKAPKN